MSSQDQLVLLDAEPPGTTLVESRNSAVNAVIGGGTVAGIGIGIAFGAAFGVFGPLSPLIALGGALVGGTGLVYLSRAARHLARFGAPRAAVAFVSAGVLGSMGAAWPILHGLAKTGIWSAPMWLRSGMGFTTMALSLVVLFLVLRTVIHWAIEGAGGTSDSEEPA